MQYLSHLEKQINENGVNPQIHKEIDEIEKQIEEQFWKKKP